jgi:hypothetical protein
VASCWFAAAGWVSEKYSSPTPRTGSTSGDAFESYFFLPISAEP